MTNYYVTTVRIVVSAENAFRVEQAIEEALKDVAHDWEYARVDNKRAWPRLATQDELNA